MVEIDFCVTPCKTFLSIVEILQKINSESMTKSVSSLQSFSHKALESRETIWSMSEVPKVKEYLHVVKDESRRKLCASILKAFDDEVIPVIGTLAREAHFLVLHKLT